MLKLFIIALLLPSVACADEWTRADTNREVAYQTLAAVDWFQTRNIARNPDRWHEQNVILGEHPSVDRVDTYFVLTGLAHYFISDALPEKYRAPFQYVSIGIELGVVAHNVSIRVRANY